MIQLDISDLRNLYRLNYIQRYNTWPKVNTEVVASHSFFVGLFTMHLCEIFEVGLLVKLSAYKVALLHDVPETITNDITYDAKQRMPEVNKLLESVEKDIIQESFEYAYDNMFCDVEEDDRIAKAIVKLADVLSVIQYCDNEVLLGNVRFKPLLLDAYDRLQIQKNKLEGLGIKCQKITI